MATFQSIAENLLLQADAGRVTIHLVAPDGGLTCASEAVQHGARQLRNDPANENALERAIVEELKHEEDIRVWEDVKRDAAPGGRALTENHGIHAQALAPVVLDGRLAAIISVHDVRGPRQWSAVQRAVLRAARDSTQLLLHARAQRTFTASKEDLRDAAIQALLDGTRLGLGVQRCTFRQSAEGPYAFPVTHESRAEGVWSLRGDLTINQRTQPVIVRMLAERLPVIQNDSRSATADPVFQTMLDHYGDMRAQIVTPLFREDSLAGVLSIHNLKRERVWTQDEIDFARSAGRMLGLLIGATLA